MKNYEIDGRKLTYKIYDDGYDICLDYKPWISQREPFIPYPSLGYEGSCIKQIEQLSGIKSGSETTEERLQVLENENKRLGNVLDDVLTNIIPTLVGESEENEDE